MLGDLFITVGAKLEGFRLGMNEVKSSLNTTSADVKRAGTAMTAGLTLPLVGAGIAALKVAGDLEQAGVAFKTMLGSSEAASQHLLELKQFALKTPFQFAELVTASKRMQAFGFEAKEVIPMLTNIGDATAGLGLGAEGIQRIVVALGQMQGKGRVMTQEMNQITEVGIPAWEILAKTLGTNVAGAMKAVEDRTVSAGVAIPAILAGMNSKFGGLMEAQSKTLLGQWSNIKDQLFFTLADIGSTLAPAAKDAMQNVFSPLLERVKDLAAGFAALPQPVRDATIAIAALLAALGPATYLIGAVAGAVMKLVGVLGIALPMLANISTAIKFGLIGALTGAETAVLASAALLGIGMAATIARAFAEEMARRSPAFAKAFNWHAEDNLPSPKEMGFTPKSGGGEFSGPSESRAAHRLAASDPAKKKRADPAAPTTASHSIAAWIAAEKLSEAQDRAKNTLQDYFIAAREGHEVIKPLWSAEQVEKFSLTLKAEMLGDAEAVDSLTWALRDAQANTAKIAEVDMSKLRVGILETDDVMRSLGLNSTRALRQVYDGALAAAKRIVELRAEGKATDGDLTAAMTKVAEAHKDLSQQTTNWTANTKTATKTGIDFGRQVSTVFTDLSRSLSDLIFSGKGMKGLEDAFKQVGKSIVRIILEDIIGVGIKSLMGALSGLLSHLGSVGKAIGGLIGGGASAAGSAAGGVAGAGSSVAGSAASVAGTGLAGVVGAVGSVVSAVSSVIGNFQMAGMNKSLDLIVNHTLRIFNEIFQQRIDHWSQYNHMYDRVGEVMNTLRDGGAGGGAKIYIYNPTFGGGTTQAQVTEFMQQAFREAHASVG